MTNPAAPRRLSNPTQSIAPMFERSLNVPDEHCRPPSPMLAT